MKIKRIAKNGTCVHFTDLVYKPNLYTIPLQFDTSAVRTIIGYSHFNAEDSWESFISELTNMRVDHLNFGTVSRPVNGYLSYIQNVKLGSTNDERLDLERFYFYVLNSDVARLGCDLTDKMFYHKTSHGSIHTDVDQSRLHEYYSYYNAKVALNLTPMLSGKYENMMDYLNTLKGDYQI